MNKSTLLPLFAVLTGVAAPALAQSRADMLEAWGAAHEALIDARAARDEARAAYDAARAERAQLASRVAVAGQKLAKARQVLLSRAGVGSSLVKDLDSAGVALTVAPGQTQPCALTTSNGKSTVSCSDSLAFGQVSDAALRLTEQAGALRLAKMPDSAEKDYMIISLAARSWIEAGGQVMSEPATRARMSPWWDRAMSAKGSPADYAPSGATRKKSLDELITANNAAQAATQAKIDAEEKIVETANCESDGQFALNARHEQELKLKTLRDEAAALQAWKKALDSFTGEEKAWLTAWTPT